MAISCLKSSRTSGKAERTHGKQALNGGHVWQQYQIQRQRGLACDVFRVFHVGHSWHKQAISPGGLVRGRAFQCHGRGSIPFGQMAQMDVCSGVDEQRRAAQYLARRGDLVGQYSGALCSIFQVDTGYLEGGGFRHQSRNRL